MQYIYLLKQGAITKIGITTRPKERKKEIKSDTGKGFKVLFFGRILFAKEIEAKIKAKYKHLKFEHKGGLNGRKVRGKDEFFKFTLLNRLKIQIQLALIWFLSYFLISLVATMFLYGLFKLIQDGNAN